MRSAYDKDVVSGAELAPGVIFLGWDNSLPRGAAGCKCPRCGGYAEDTDPTSDEIAAGPSCGRPGCCMSVFVCGLCGARIVASIEAPDMDFNC